jgi:hypothetical protein
MFGDPYFLSDVLRVANIALTAICVGCYGYGFWLYFRNRRAQLTTPDSPLFLALTFSASYLLLLASGVVVDIIRIHQPLSLYTPIHLAGVLIGLAALYASSRIALRRWRQGKKL